MELRTRTSVRDTSFFFRVRRRPATAGVPQYLYGYGLGNGWSSCRRAAWAARLQAARCGAPTPTTAAAAGPRHCRFVFCRQRQDERLRRGGEQKAVVVLSALPLTSVLVPVSRFLGPLVLSYGAEALEQVGPLTV